MFVILCSYIVLEDRGVAGWGGPWVTYIMSNGM